MKKIVINFVILIICVFNFVGCTSKTSEIAREYANTIVECFRSNIATDELEQLFCENIASTHNLDEEIAGAIAFIDGNIVSTGDWYGMSEGGSAWDNGKQTELHIKPGMKQIETDTGRTYDISFYAFLICDDPNFVGITRITIWSDNDETYMIGEVVN